MAFEFKCREISKREIIKLRRKYAKKISHEKADYVEIVCELFMKLVYVYFDNTQEKLRRLFYPVVMANFIENGSIHSVIEEYRESKHLYSWSYTYRILRKLDEDAGLEISRIFRKVLFYIARTTGFKNKGYAVAIDITAKPFYGNRNLIMVKGSKRTAGTNYSIQYLTASIIEEGVRFNLLCIPISSISSVPHKFDALVREIRKMVHIKLFFLDRGFANKKYSGILKCVKHKFLMPLARNHKLKEMEICMKEQSIVGQDEYALAVLAYVFNDNRSDEYQLNLRLIVFQDEEGVFFFITNLYHLTIEEYYELTLAYRYRFGIETNYRVDNIFTPFSSSIMASIRYMLMQLSLIAQDLWTLVNFLMHKPDERQPREFFKRNYSSLGIVRARIHDIGWIWRPLMTAVQFKRKVDKILG